MTIDAIVANMDHVWSNVDDNVVSTDASECGDALKRFLQGIKDDGYPILLVSNLSAATLNDAINATLGRDGIAYFSAILSAQSLNDRYALALHTLETGAHRVMAVASSESELQEARAFGFASCIHINDAMRRPPASPCSDFNVAYGDA
jgi:hypothetical protein